MTFYSLYNARNFNKRISNKILNEVPVASIIIFAYEFIIVLSFLPCSKLHLKIVKLYTKNSNNNSKRQTKNNKISMLFLFAKDILIKERIYLEYSDIFKKNSIKHLCKTLKTIQ